MISAAPKIIERSGSCKLGGVGRQRVMHGREELGEWVYGV